MRTLTVLAAAGLALAAPVWAHAQSTLPAATQAFGAARLTPNRADNLSRPLRYRPEGADFVIENGTGNFNRPLYGRATALRIDAGDRPEFALNTPKKAGVLRLGLRRNGKAIWLTRAARVVARYRPGAMLYDVSDPAWGGTRVDLAVLPNRAHEGLVLRAELSGGADGAELLWAFAGGSDKAANERNGDIIAERDPAAIMLPRREDVAGNTVASDGATAVYTNRAGAWHFASSAGATFQARDFSEWDVAGAAAGATTVAAPDHPILAGRVQLRANEPVYLAIGRGESVRGELAEVFAAAEAARAELAGQVVVETPDPFVNASAAALAVAADAVWQPPTVMHGAIAWRLPLLGWRGPYALDALGCHDRMRTHLRHWAAQQNTDPAEVTSTPRADPEKNLAADDGKSLHGFGGIPARHYDMNLVFVDALFRHLLWTGDRELARELWPFLQRHLAWEKRLFDRGGIYEGYCCIWASDALTYNGGGTAHASAYNYFHHLMAARVAGWIGEEGAAYAAEAERIHAAMNRELWLEEPGCFAEYRELHGLKRAHPAAALWSAYHVIDSRVPDERQRERLLDYVDAQLARIPVRGAGVPEGDWFVLPTTNWVPYEWSLNNVVLAENAHTALAYWQGGRNETAWRLWKGALLDAMFMGVSPGNLPNLSHYDVYRRETYRDFADAIGSFSRSLVEGLFGLTPDALAGELTVRPGYPAAWERAAIRLPQLAYAFTREGDTDRYVIEPRLPWLKRVRLHVPAMKEAVQRVTVNGREVAATVHADASGRRWAEIAGDAASRTEIVVTWSGAVVREPKRAVQPVDEAAPDATFAAIPAAAAGWQPIDLTPHFNDRVSQIFRNEYLAPRSPYTSLSMPKQGIGSWSGFRVTAEIDDAGLRATAGASGRIAIDDALTLRTPGEPEARNVAFVSHWDNYPREITIPLSGRGQSLAVLVAGSTGPMQSQIDNGEIVVTYADGTTARLALHNPTTWWPIEQDYFVDEYAFRRTAPVPLRVELGTGKVYRPDGTGGHPRGGAATVLTLPLDQRRELRTLTVRALSTEVVVGLLAASVARSQ